MVIKIKKMKLTDTFYFFLSMNTAFVLGLSQLHYFTLIKFIEMFLYLIGFVFFFTHFYKNMSMKLKPILLLVSLTFIGITSYLFSEGATLLKIVMFSYIMINTEKNDILQYTIISLMIPVLLILLASCIGIIEIKYLSGTKIALSFGFVNPNTVPVILFAIISGYNILRFCTLNIRIIIIELFITVMLYFLCKSRTGSLVLLLYILLVSMFKIVRSRRIKKICTFPMQYTVVIFAMISILLCVIYNPNSILWRNINVFFSGRLLAWQNYFKFYPITFFGNELDTSMFGALDNAYIMFLIQYGLIAFFAYLFMFIYISKLSYKASDWIVIISAFCLEIYSLTEYGPTLINLCPVLILALWNGMNKINVKCEYPHDNPKSKTNSSEH